MTFSFFWNAKLVFIAGILTILYNLHPVQLHAEQTCEYGAYKIQLYTEADGLISSEVTGIYKDRYGFLWVSTFDGLSRYDGHDFENFNQTSGLKGNNVEIIGEDDTGQLFVRSITHIYKYTGSTVMPFVSLPASGAFIALACPYQHNNVLVAYDGMTGFDLLSTAGRIAHIATDVPVIAIVKGLHSRYYVLENNGRLSVLEKGKLTPVYNIRPLNRYINKGIRICKGAKGKVWTSGTNNRYIYEHDGAVVTDSIAMPAATRWWQWIIGAAGSVYMASDTGSIAVLKNGHWETMLTKSQIRGSIYELQESADTVLWVCASSGLLKISRRKYSNVPTGMPLIYSATDANGRYILCSDSLLYHIPQAIKSYYALQSQTLTNIYVTHRRDVWYCTEAAVYHLPYGKKLQQLNTSNTYAGSNALFRFRRILEDHTGGIWISSYSGIFYFKDSKLSYYYVREGLTEGAVYTVAIDRNGTFYAAGIRVFAFRNGRFHNISPQLNLQNEIARLSTDQNKEVWVCQNTSKIIRIGQGVNGTFFPADSLHCSISGLPFNAATLTFDLQNNLWICDNKSLYCYKFHDNHYKERGYPVCWNEHLSGNPLLYSDDRNNLQILSNPLAGNYLRTYHAASLLQNYHPDSPHIWLTSIRLFRKNFDWATAGYATNAMGIPRHPHLQPGQNFLKFYFTGLTSDYTQGLTYHYRLRGYDNAWSPVIENGEAEYTGLPSGSYILEVQARIPGKDWGGSMLYPFEINAVWYARWWAIICWMVLGCGVVGGIIFLIWKALERRSRLHRLVVEEQLKALRAQINPHFLQNTFAFLAHEMYTSSNSNAVKAIDRISMYLRNVLHFSDKASVTLEEELEFAEEYLQLQQQLLSISFKYHIDVAEEVDVFDLYVPSMLFQPVIENALKHGIDPVSDNMITICIDMKDAYVRCVVSDTGNAGSADYDPVEDMNGGKGIKLTIERMELFYTGKKLKPRFLRQGNASGGCDVTLLIPTK